MNHLDRRNVTGVAFDVVLRGYDKRQVEERLRLVGAELAAARDALRAATERVATLEDALHQTRSAPTDEPSGDVHFGARVEKILKLAEDEAREVRAQAEAAAVALLDQARAQAAEQLQRAEQEIVSWRTEANQARTAAGTEAEELFRVATTDAEQVSKAAHAEAEQLVAQARAEAQRLMTAATDTAAQRARSSAHELHQLSRLQEEINSDLYRVKDVLDSLFGPGGAVTGALLHKRRQDGVQLTHQARPV